MRSLKTPILLGLCCFLVYNANLRQIGSGDTVPARYLPLILWHNGTLDLESNARLVAHGHSMIEEQNRPAGAEGKVTYFEPWAYWTIRTREHQLASLYPVVTPLLVAPLYVPAVIWLNRNGWEQPQIDRVAELMEKISASLLASIASVIMYLVLRRDGGRWSLPLAIAFAFGTNTWMISSQALWQHGTGELLIALALLLVVARGSPIRTALLGAVCVLMAANRPPDGLIAGAIILFTFWSRRRSALWLLAGAALPLAVLLYYNLDFIGHVAGGYALGKNPNTAFFNLNWSGVAGLLVSPTRGLLVFSPFPYLRSARADSALAIIKLERSRRGAECCGSRAVFTLLAGRLARRSVVGSALANRRFADPDVDARARSAHAAPAHARPAHPRDSGFGRRADSGSFLVYEGE